MLCLGLDRTPATDLIDGTVMAWREALADGRVWDQARDTPRIRAAFVLLARTRESWPAPRHFIDALPRVEQAAIGYEVKPATPDEASAAMARIRAMLGKEHPNFRPESRIASTVPAAEKAQAERDLAEHYGKTGKVAACGPDA